MNRQNASQQKEIADLIGEIPALGNKLRALAVDITGAGKHQPGHLTQRAVNIASQLDELYSRYKQSVEGESEQHEEPEERVAGEPMKPIDTSALPESGQLGRPGQRSKK